MLRSKRMKTPGVVAGAGGSLDHAGCDPSGSLGRLTLAMRTPVVKDQTTRDAATSETPPQPIGVLRASVGPDVSVRVPESGIARLGAILNIPQVLTGSLAVGPEVVVVGQPFQNALKCCRHRSFLSSITSSRRATYFRPRLTNYRFWVFRLFQNEQRPPLFICVGGSGVGKKIFSIFYLTRFHRGFLKSVEYKNRRHAA